MFSSIFQGFNSFAELVIERGAISLIHSSYKFIRDRVDKGRSYWRCRHSFKYNCKARVVTKLINGYEMMKVRNGEHNHAEIRKPKKAKRKMSKAKKKATAAPRVIRPNFDLMNLPPLIPSHLPKLTPKSIPNNDVNQPADDIEPMVNILD